MINQNYGEEKMFRGIIIFGSAGSGKTHWEKWLLRD